MTMLQRIQVFVVVNVCSLVSLALSAASPFNGYTFVFSGSTASLYDMDKRIIKQWTGLRANAGCADLLRDSSLLWPSSDRGSWTRGGALTGGRLQIIKWDGTIVWDYLYRSADYMPHHDIEPVYYTNDPREKPNILVICYTAWGDKITELKPTGLNTAEVVWEWYASDHTCEAGTGTDKPELLDKGKGASIMGGDFDRMHTNNVSFNRTLNQLVLSVNGYNEMIVIDHSTTTAQAKGRTGGRWGKGGDILFRWGMPSNYGVTGTTYLNRQHGCCWIQDTMLGTNLRIPGAFNMLAVDNGGKRVLEINPAGNNDGIYPRTPGTAFEPAAPLWTYSVSDLQRNEGSVQRLPNGNTLICNGGVGGMGGTGRVFELSPSGTIVWELTNIAPSTEAVRYAYGYLDAKVGLTVRSEPDYATRQRLRITTNPFTGSVALVPDAGGQCIGLSLFTLNGRELLRRGSPSTTGWHLGNYGAGHFLVRISSENGTIGERVPLGN